VARDIEAMITSSQTRVKGEVRVSLKQGRLAVEGIRSPFSMMDAKQATYGETQSLWDGRDAEGFAKIYGIQGRLAVMTGPENK
jgi:argininosuccinate synthase